MYLRKHSQDAGEKRGSEGARRANRGIWRREHVVAKHAAESGARHAAAKSKWVAVPTVAACMAMIAAIGITSNGGFLRPSVADDTIPAGAPATTSDSKTGAVWTGSDQLPLTTTTSYPPDGSTDGRHDDMGVATWVGGNMAIGTADKGSYAAEAEGLTVIAGDLSGNVLKNAWNASDSTGRGGGFRWGRAGFGSQYRPHDGSEVIAIGGNASMKTRKTFFSDNGYTGKVGGTNNTVTGAVDGSNGLLSVSDSTPGNDGKGITSGTGKDDTLSNVTVKSTDGKTDVSMDLTDYFNTSVKPLSTGLLNAQPSKSPIDGENAAVLVGVAGSDPVLRHNYTDASVWYRTCYYGTTDTECSTDSKGETYKPLATGSTFTVSSYQNNEKLITFDGSKATSLNGDTSVKVFTIDSDQLSDIYNGKTYRGVDFAFINIGENDTVVVNVIGDKVSFHTGWKFYWSENANLGDNLSDANGSSASLRATYARAAQHLLWNFTGSDVTIYGGVARSFDNKKTEDDPAAAMVGSIIVNGDFESHVTTNGRVYVSGDFSMNNPYAVVDKDGNEVNVTSGEGKSASVINMDQERHNYPFSVPRSITWTKVDSTDTSKKLSGATFKVWTYVHGTDSSGNPTTTLTQVTSADVTDNGDGTYTVNNLEGDSDYYIKETAAPSDYVLDSTAATTYYWVRTSGLKNVVEHSVTVKDDGKTFAYDDNADAQLVTLADGNKAIGNKPKPKPQPTGAVAAGKILSVGEGATDPNAMYTFTNEITVKAAGAGQTAPTSPATVTLLTVNADGTTAEATGATASGNNITVGGATVLTVDGATSLQIPLNNDTVTIKVAAGYAYKIDGLPEGSTVKVSETDIPTGVNFTSFSCVTTGCAATGTTAADSSATLTVTSGATPTAIATNTVPAPMKTGSVTMGKYVDITNGAEPAGATYTFDNTISVAMPGENQTASTDPFTVTALKVTRAADGTYTTADATIADAGLTCTQGCTTAADGITIARDTTKATITLKSGYAYKIDGLTEGSTVTVTEKSIPAGVNFTSFDCIDSAGCKATNAATESGSSARLTLTAGAGGNLTPGAVAHNTVPEPGRIDVIATWIKTDSTDPDKRLAGSVWQVQRTGEGTGAATTETACVADNNTTGACTGTTLYDSDPREGYIALSSVETTPAGYANATFLHPDQAHRYTFTLTETVPPDRYQLPDASQPANQYRFVFDPTAAGFDKTTARTDTLGITRVSDGEPVTQIANTPKPLVDLTTTWKKTDTAGNPLAGSVWKVERFTGTSIAAGATADATACVSDNGATIPESAGCATTLIDADGTTAGTITLSSAASDTDAAFLRPDNTTRYTFRVTELIAPTHYRTTSGASYTFTSPDWAAADVQASTSAPYAVALSGLDATGAIANPLKTGSVEVHKVLAGATDRVAAGTLFAFTNTFASDTVTPVLTSYPLTFAQAGEGGTLATLTSGVTAVADADGAVTVTAGGQTIFTCASGCAVVGDAARITLTKAAPTVSVSLAPGYAYIIGDLPETATVTVEETGLTDGITASLACGNGCTADAASPQKATLAVSDGATSQLTVTNTVPQPGRIDVTVTWNKTDDAATDADATLLPGSVWKIERAAVEGGAAAATACVGDNGADVTGIADCAAAGVTALVDTSATAGVIELSSASGKDASGRDDAFLRPDGDQDHDYTFTVTEVQAPEGYVKSDASYTFAYEPTGVTDKLAGASLTPSLYATSDTAKATPVTRIANTPKPLVDVTVTWKKTDTAGNPLAGSVWKVARTHAAADTEAAADKTVCVSDDNVTIPESADCAATISDAAAGAESGAGTITLSSLTSDSVEFLRPDNTYRYTFTVSELIAPAHYQKSEDAYTFTSPDWTAVADSTTPVAVTASTLPSTGIVNTPYTGIVAVGKTLTGDTANLPEGSDASLFSFENTYQSSIPAVLTAFPLSFATIGESGALTPVASYTAAADASGAVTVTAGGQTIFTCASGCAAPTVTSASITLTAGTPVTVRIAPGYAYEVSGLPETATVTAHETNIPTGVNFVSLACTGATGCQTAYATDADKATATLTVARDATSAAIATNNIPEPGVIDVTVAWSKVKPNGGESSIGGVLPGTVWKIVRTSTEEGAAPTATACVKDNGDGTVADITGIDSCTPTSAEGIQILYDTDRADGPIVLSTTDSRNADFLRPDQKHTYTFTVTEENAPVGYVLPEQTGANATKYTFLYDPAQAVDGKLKLGITDANERDGNINDPPIGLTVSWSKTSASDASKLLSGSVWKITRDDGQTACVKDNGAGTADDVADVAECAGATVLLDSDTTEGKITLESHTYRHVTADGKTRLVADPVGTDGANATFLRDNASDGIDASGEYHVAAHTFTMTEAKSPDGYELPDATQPADQYTFTPDWASVNTAAAGQTTLAMTIYTAADTAKATQVTAIANTPITTALPATGRFGGVWLFVASGALVLLMSGMALYMGLRRRE